MHDDEVLVDKNSKSTYYLAIGVGTLFCLLMYDYVLDHILFKSSSSPFLFIFAVVLINKMVGVIARNILKCITVPGGRFSFPIIPPTP